MAIGINPVALTKKLVGISSVSGDEGEAAKYIAVYLRAAGFRPILQRVEGKRMNVVVKGNGPLLFNGHIDTVPVGERSQWHHHPFGEVTKTRLYGRGSCDTKGTIAAFLAALVKTRNKKVSCSFVVGEEETFVGIKTLMKIRKSLLPHVRYCIDFEPTNLKIVVAHKGQMRVRVSVRGVPAHGSVPEKGRNAVMEMAQVVITLGQYAKELRKRRDALVGHATVNVGVMKGGVMYNVVPVYAELELDRRILPQERMSAVVRELARVVRPARAEILNRYQPVQLDKGNDTVVVMQRVLSGLQLPTKVHGVRFTTQFSEMVKYGIQGCVFGVGSVAQAHAVDEYILLQELKLAHKTFMRLLS